MEVKPTEEIPRVDGHRAAVRVRVSVRKKESRVGRRGLASWAAYTQRRRGGG